MPLSVQTGYAMKRSRRDSSLARLTATGELSQGRRRVAHMTDQGAGSDPLNVEPLNSGGLGEDSITEPEAPPVPQEEEEEAQRSRPRRTRTPRTFPASSFLEALPLAEAIQRFAAGQRIRRLTLFENLGRSADSGPTRQLITNSGQYGLTRGSYNAEWLELTDEGRLASGDDSLGRARLAARLELAIARIVPFNLLYEQYSDNRLPALAVLRDYATDNGVAADHVNECVETFLANARELGLVRTYAGAERLLTFELVLEELAEGASYVDTEQQGDDGDRPLPPLAVARPVTRETSSPARILAEASDLSNVCFIVSPIGSEGSEQRKHSNLILGSLIEPALDGFDLRIVRADKISKPGMITAQVIDHLVRAPLVIADLSYGNPNVYYELALRHACRKPVVQIIRSSDHLPFDVGQFRTVPLDMTDLYSFVPQLDGYRAEIARQCRAALDEDGPADSPLSVFYARFWEQFVAT